jgi:DNA-binding IclR family transcriptional regulator
VHVPTIAPEPRESRSAGIQVIARASELLRLLAAEPEGLALKDLAARAALPRSTVHRIVGALAYEGFVRTSPNGNLRVGPTLVGIAVSSRRDIRREAQPYLRKLSEEVQETVDLAIRDGSKAFFIDQQVSPRTLRIVAEIGSRHPLYCTASGKALLSMLPPAEVERLLPRRLRPATDHTITDRAVLMAELEEVRLTGIAYDREENSQGICAIATAVQTPGGETASISVVLPAARCCGEEKQIVASLLKTRDELQAVLDGAPRGGRLGRRAAARQAHNA